MMIISKQNVWNLKHRIQQQKLWWSKKKCLTLKTYRIKEKLIKKRATQM